MHSIGKNSWLKHLDFIVIDLVCLAASFIFAYYLHFGDLSLFGSHSWQGLLGVLLLLNLVITFLMNPYSGVLRRAYYEDAFKMGLLAAYGFISACVFFYLFKLGEDYSRITLASSYLIYYLVSMVAKSIRKKWMLSSNRSGSADVRSLMVVADYDHIDEMIELINASDFKEFDVVALCFPSTANGDIERYRDLPVVPFQDLAEHTVANGIDDVFVGTDPKLLDSSTYEMLVSNGVVVRLSVEGMVGMQSDVQSLERVGVYKTVGVASYKTDSRKVVYFGVKRICDIVLAMFGCVLLLPIAAVTKVSYLLQGDRAPIIYRQTRVGLRGNRFQLYKLRSMVPNADEVLQELLKDPQREAEWEAEQKFTDDPRITKIGAFLRNTSLDEFPQFLNVIKGDMSIVGPRPLVPGELEGHNGLSLYNKVKPGVTGWWGCNGRSNIVYRERLELEYYYVRHCSLYLDALCIIRTFVAVFKREGAK